MIGGWGSDIPAPPHPNRMTDEIQAPAGDICPECGFVAKNRAGLVAHQRSHIGPSTEEVQRIAGEAQRGNLVPGVGKRLNVAARSNEQGLRGRVMAIPRCQIPVVVHGKTEWTTGPCQQAVKDTPSLAFSWFKNCTHGPERDVEGNIIPEEMRPYYETNVFIKSTPVVGERGEIKEWNQQEFYSADLRLKYVAINSAVMGGKALQRSAARGGKFAEELGYAPFCMYFGCYRQDVQKFSNGLFCTDTHAAFVLARETTTFIPIGGFDASWPQQTSTAKRREVLSQLKEKVRA